MNDRRYHLEVLCPRRSDWLRYSLAYSTDALNAARQDADDLLSMEAGSSWAGVRVIDRETGQPVYSGKRKLH